MKNVLEMEGDDGCVAMGIYLVALSCIFKMVNFYVMCLSPQFKIMSHLLAVQTLLSRVNKALFTLCSWVLMGD